VHDLAVIAITSVLMSALVITRLAMALAKHRRAVARERALREACSRLVGAASAVEVSVAVREAVGELVPPGLNHLAIVAIYDLTAPEAADPVAGIMIRYPLPSASHRRTRLLSTRTLHPDLRDQLAGYPATLACTLVANRSEALDPGLGALLVAADSRVLNAIQDSVEVLAAQATMALERIALTDMVNRNDNDRYLRTVTQGSVDVVLIVDDDQHIRYASPSLGGMLGGEAPMFATLRDIVAAGEHEQIDRTLRASQRSTQPEGARDWWHLPRLDGTALSVEVNCRDLRQDRMVRGFVITLRDVTDEDSRQRDLIQRALHASPAGRNRRASRRRFN
jgi:PAS domain S-box-containing protein